jgi:predicted urease superfamily metal-dependent hydrolase
MIKKGGKDMENTESFVLHFRKAKEKTIKKIAKIVREEGWSYEDLRYVYHRVRELLDLNYKYKLIISISYEEQLT